MSNKWAVFLTGRVHPGESNSSWIMHGLINFLIGPSSVARQLRDRCVFYIVPMINPDGVIIGNQRCDFIGYDLNWTFSTASKVLQPVPFYIKQLIKDVRTELWSTYSNFFYFDIHSHSTKKGIFMYGPHYMLHEENYMKIRMIPKLLSEWTDMFRYYSCKFMAQDHLKECAWLSIWRAFHGMIQCFTLEASYFGYISKDRMNIEFKEKNLQ